MVLGDSEGNGEGKGMGKGSSGLPLNQYWSVPGIPVDTKWGIRLVNFALEGYRGASRT